MEPPQHRQWKRNWTPTETARAVGVGFALLLTLIGIFSSYYTVDPEEEAVVLRFGRYHSTRPPGLHFKLPFGIDAAIKVPVTEVRREEFGFHSEPGRRTRFTKREDESLMLTGDLNIADVDWVVQYKIKDARDWIFNVKEQEETIRDLSEAVMRAVVGDHTVTEVLTSKRNAIAEQALKALQERLDDYKMGVHIVTIKLQNANPPDAVRDSFNDVNAAQQELSRAENEAQREYNKVVEVALGDAKREVAEAEGYKANRVNRAKGDVARFVEMLKVYKAHKEVTRQRLYLEAMERVLPKVKRILVVDNEGILKLLPLSEAGR